MAEIKLLAQGLIENNDHLSAVNQLLHLEDATEIFISVAYARKSGVIAIGESLSSKKDIANLYIGISNGVTSLQAIIEILKIGIHPYVIDVGISKRLYHPKIYAAFSNSTVELIIGSANLTNRGLNCNYEASSHIALNTSIQSDNEYITALKNAFCELEKRFPNNVIKISTVKEAVKLFRDGLLEDERIIKLPTTKKIKSHRSSIPRKPIASRISPTMQDNYKLKNEFPRFCLHFKNRYLYYSHTNINSDYNSLMLKELKNVNSMGR